MENNVGYQRPTQCSNLHTCTMESLVEMRDLPERENSTQLTVSWWPLKSWNEPSE